MRKNVGIDGFVRLKRLRDGPTNQPTDGPMDMSSYRGARTHMQMVYKTVPGACYISPTGTDMRTDGRSLKGEGT